MANSWSRILVAASTCAVLGLAYAGSQPWAIAQTTGSGELYYWYFGQKIPLKLRQDVIVAEGKAPTQLSGSEPYYRTLRRHLRGGGTLSGDDNSNPPGLQLDPIGNQYVLIGLSSAAQGQREQIQKNIQAEPNLKGTLPVLTVGDRASSMLVLPNRILVSFKAGTSESVIQAILKRQNLAIITKEPFTDTGYVVRSTNATGTTILNVANQLSQDASVEYATPDFIQVPARVPDNPLNKALDRQSSDRLLDILENLPKQAYSPSAPRLLPFQWHLNSVPLSQCLQASTGPWNCLFKSPATPQSTVKRIDIRAKEAWAVSTLKGRGVVVAVIDSGVQTNHEDLSASLHRVNNPACLKETAGWDFTNESDQGTGCLKGDPLAAIDPQETDELREKLRDAVTLPDRELIQKYPRDVEEVEQYCRDKRLQCSPDTIARMIRSSLKGYVTQSFHGTNVAGVIAASSPNGKGLLGVAPNAKIVPIRALGLGGTGAFSATARAIRYAAALKVDVINLSLGPSVPLVDPATATEIAKVLAANPNLVIVASAGNEAGRFPGVVMPPACIPGVVSVGATNLAGGRAAYSNFGTANWSRVVRDKPSMCGTQLQRFLPNLDPDDPWLDVVAPGGEMQSHKAIEGLPIAGLFTTGETFIPGLWRGWKAPNRVFNDALDPNGRYIWTQGTSFSAPAVAGVIALMKAEDPQRQLTRQQLVTILKQTASYDNLDGSSDAEKYKGKVPNGVSPNQFFFGSGLVNAEAAVREVKRQVGR